MNRRGVDNRRKLRSSESSTENPLLWRHKQRDMTSSSTCDVVQQRHSMTTTLTPSETAADSSWIRTLGHHHPGLPVPPPADPLPGKGVRHHPGLPTAAASELVYPPDCGVATWASTGDTCCYLYDTTGISISDDQHLAESGQSALDAFSTLPLQVCCYRLLTCVFVFSDLNNQ